MTLESNASKVEHGVANALDTSDQAASQKIITEVNQDLSKMSAPEKSYVENDLQAKGVLPDLAIKTGVVAEDEYVTKEDLTKLGESEGPDSLKGMAARYLAENFETIAGNRQDIDANDVEGFDGRIDLAVQTCALDEGADAQAGDGEEREAGRPQGVAPPHVGRRNPGSPRTV